MRDLAERPQHQLRDCWWETDERSCRPHAWDERPTPSPERRLSLTFWVFSAKKADFDALVAQWRPRARRVSVPETVAMLPAYQQMIGLGRDAIPLILGRLATDPSSHWFWALEAIAREDPTDSQSTVQEAVDAWLRWGRAKGYVSG